MAASSDILEWIERGKEDGATHLVVVCDTFDYDDFPVFVSKDEDVHEVVAAKNNDASMTKVMEVYWLGDTEEGLEKQVNLHRSFTYGP